MVYNILFVFHNISDFQIIFGYFSFIQSSFEYSSYTFFSICVNF